MSAPPLQSPWHFRHLGRDYFKPIFDDCRRTGIWPLRRIYTGKTREPYIKKTRGRDVNPNWMVEDVAGNFRTNERGLRKEHMYDMSKVHTWDPAEVERRFDLDVE